MNDYQRIVDDLRNTVLFGGANREVRLDEQLREYGDACRATNDRLRQCEAMLRKGLRSEAIRLAEIEPNLLDLVAMLDFPERQQVAASLSLMHRDLPPLSTSVASDLNEAYSAHRPLESLLSRHRFLALVRAPLKERLGVLRHIEQVDSLNPVWAEDIEAYETERFREIQVEGNRAVAQDDVRKLDELATELNSSPWRQPVPAMLEQTLEKARRKARQTQAGEELLRLQKELNLAHASMDWETAEELKSSWHALLLDYSPPPGDPILQRVEPVMRWLAERQARNAERAEAEIAVARLSTVLDAFPPADRATLEAVRRDLANRGYDVPEIVGKRYRSRIAEFDRAARKRLLARAGAGAAALLVIGAAVVFVVGARARAARLEAALAELAPRVKQARDDADKLPAARKVLDLIEAAGGDAADQPAIRGLAAEVNKMEEAERKRSATFRDVMNVATAGGPSAPNLAELDIAEQYARTAAEKDEIAGFRAAIADVAGKTQQRAEQAMLADLEGLKRRLADLEKQEAADMRTPQEARALKTDAAGLAARHPQAGTAAAEAVRAIIARAGEIESAAARDGSERAALKTVFSSQYDLNAYASALRRFVQEYPDSSATPGFKQAVSEAYLWKKIEDWNLGRTTLAGLEADLAKRNELVAHLDAAITNFAQFPEVDRLKARRSFALDRLNRFDAGGVQMATALRAPFENPLLSDSWVLTTSRGDRYYLLREAKKAQGVATQRVEYVVDFVLTQRAALVPPEDIASIERSPHCEMVAQVLAELDRMRSEGDTYWETGFTNLVRIILNANKAEPLLRLAALKRIVSAAAAGSGPIREAIASETAVLEHLSANLLVTWMDPKNSDAKAASQAALQDLARLGDLEVKLAGADGVAARLRKELKPLSSYVRRGLLNRESKDAWTCVPIGSDQTVPPVSLLVAVPDASGSVLREVGRSTSEGIKIDAADPKLLVEGRPVWFAAEK